MPNYDPDTLVHYAKSLEMAANDARKALMWVINYDSEDKIIARAIAGIDRLLPDDTKHQPAHETTMWFELKGDERIKLRCATHGCGGQPTWRLEIDGIGSNYCTGCKVTIEADNKLCNELRRRGMTENRI